VLKGEIKALATKIFKKIISVKLKKEDYLTFIFERIE
jgi:hypothetical protein